MEEKSSIIRSTQQKFDKTLLLRFKNGDLIICRCEKEIKTTISSSTSVIGVIEINHPYLLGYGHNLATNEEVVTFMRYMPVCKDITHPIDISDILTGGYPLPVIQQRYEELIVEYEKSEKSRDEGFKIVVNGGESRH